MTAKRPGAPVGFKEVHMDRASLLALRRAYAGLRVSAHKQIGLRAIRDALALADRNPERVAELWAKARFHLPYAEAAA